MSGHNDIVGITPKFFFGINTEIRGNVQHINEDEILYPNGGVLVLHNYPGKRQKYIKLPDKGYSANLICLSPNRRIIAVAEIGDPANIVLYDVATLKRKRTLTIPAEKQITSRAIEVMTFTGDSRNLLAIYGEPDWTMVSFRADRGKIESHTRANNLNNTGIVRDIACNPMDTSVVVLVGDILFRMLAVTENIWRQFGYSKAEGFYIKAAAWLSQERLVAGTREGNFMVVENGELKMILKLTENSSINFHARDDIQQASLTALLSSMGSEQFEDFEISKILVFAKGFLVAIGVGKVLLFEKETAHKYKKRNLFKLEEFAVQKHVGIFEEHSEHESTAKVPLNKIHAMSLSPTQDYLVVSCGIKQLYDVYLWGPDITSKNERDKICLELKTAYNEPKFMSQVQFVHEKKLK